MKRFAEMTTEEADRIRRLTKEGRKRARLDRERDFLGPFSSRTMMFLCTRSVVGDRCIENASDFAALAPEERQRIFDLAKPKSIIRRDLTALEDRIRDARLDSTWAY